MKERKFDDFDEFALNYREVHNKNIKITGGNSDYFSEYKVIELKNKSKFKNISSILDLGCGDGNSAKYFRIHFPKSKIFGIDISLQSIEVANKRNLTNCFFSTYDGSEIPFENESFDIVFIAGVLHHVNKQYHLNILKECYRVLKPKGQLYIFEHNPYNPLTVKIVKDCIFDEDAVLLKAHYTKQLFMYSGFKQVKSYFTLFTPRSKKFSIFHKIEKYLTWFPLGGQYYVTAIK